ncbi:MAG: hypothetical protein ACO1RX_15060 [Candidatus Sericytochromatia bacterium]
MQVNETLNALQGAFQRMDASAGRSSRLNSDPNVDLLTESVIQLEARREVEAQSAVLRATDDMLGSLFDALA